MTTTRNSGDVVEHVIGEHGELILRLPSGSVDVTGVDGGTASVRDLDGRDLAERFAIERAEGRLSVRPRDRAVFDIGLGRRGRGNARLAVHVPRAATVSLDTANGDLEVTGLQGDQRYRTASGDIVVRAVSGPIAVDAVSGAVRVEAAGAVDLSGRLVSGDLSVQGGSLRSVAVATTSGDIALDSPIDGPGPFSIQTVSGDARVASAGGLRVEARTLTGEIESDLEHRLETGVGRRQLVIGSGARTLAFKSISGDLRIAAHRAAPASILAPVAPEPAPSLEPLPPSPPTAGEPPADERLAVLRELEAGSIDIETATARLAALEDFTHD
jgi:DUF4097 and DUF4098 domain-containing protein YvlB